MATHNQVTLRLYYLSLTISWILFLSLLSCFFYILANPSPAVQSPASPRDSHDKPPFRSKKCQ
jgi:hypothetical protein